MTTKTKQKRQHYSEEFKRAVIDEYFLTGNSKISLQKKYDIKMNSGIQKWIRQLSYADIHQKDRYLGRTIISSVAAKNIKRFPDPEPALAARIKELERLLEDEQLRSEAYGRMIDIAEREFNIPIRKKPNTK